LDVLNAFVKQLTVKNDSESANGSRQLARRRVAAEPYAV